MERSPGILATTIARLTHLILGGTLILLLAGLGGRWWVLELTTHFRTQYLMALAAATLLYVLVRRWRWAMAAGLATMAVGATLIPFYWPHAERAPASVSRNVRMISANILRFNADYQRTIDYVRETKPDLFFAMEITPDWAD